MNAPFAPTRANTLDAHWMGFTANKAFKANPRLFASAKGMFYTTVDGREVLDGTAGLWCVNAGHGREEIVEAIRRQAGELDYAPTFNLGHPLAFEMASAVAAIFPAGMDRVFFCNSGSEAVESALKIAIAYQRSIGEGTRTRLIGRERGYHGVGFGGISVGGMVANRRVYPAAAGRRPSALDPRAARRRLRARAAGSWSGAGRRPGAHGGAARGGDHRRGDRGAGVGLHRRADPAQGLSGAAARDRHASTASC